MVYGVIVARLEIVEPSFGVVVIATVAQGVDFGLSAGAGQQIAPCVVGILRNEVAGRVGQADDIAFVIPRQMSGYS